MLNSLENHVKTQAILTNLPSTEGQDLYAVFEYISNDSNAGKLTHIDRLRRFGEDIEPLIIELNAMLKEHDVTLERIKDCVYLSWRVQA